MIDPLEDAEGVESVSIDAHDLVEFDEFKICNKDAETAFSIQHDPTSAVLEEKAEKCP